MILHSAKIGDHELSYALCRVLPETALMLRDVVKEAARLWAAHLGAETDAAIRVTRDGEAFFIGRVRLEPVPPEREMLAVWLPFPPDFDRRIKPQLVDAVEAFDPQRGMREPPRGWPGAS